MSHIWTFSPKSQHLLQQCLNAAAPPDDSNIWYKRFGQNANLQPIDKSVAIPDSPNEIIVIPDSPDNTMQMHSSQKSKIEDLSKFLEDFLEPDLDILAKFNKLHQKTLNNPELLAEVAQNLPLNICSQLISHILSYNNISNEFLINLYKYFIPVYIKKDNSRISIDLLIQTRKTYPELLKIVLIEIVKDSDIQNNILNDYILTLNVEEQTDFLNMAMSIELSSEQFSHNLHSIYITYKNCNKTDSIQNSLFKILKSHSEYCSTNKMFGKLMLTFLQAEKFKNKTDILALQTVLEIHKSPFKRPCIAVLNDLKKS